MHAQYTEKQLKGAIDLNPKKGKKLLDPDRTKQSYLDQCNINRMMDRVKHGASLSHLANYGGEYGDFSDWDANTYEDMQIQLARANSMFEDLPAELRNEFENDPGKWLEFVNNPENKDRLEEIYPVLAAPGKQLPDVIGGLATAIENLKLEDTVAAASTIDAPANAATE